MPNPMPKPPRSLRTIAAEIVTFWPHPYFGAVPYLDAMHDLDNIEDNFFFDSGRSIVAYFLANASTWRGPKAREIKEELKAILQPGPKS